MPYVQGSAIDKVYFGSLEHQMSTIRAAIEEAFGGAPVNIVATHQDHSFVCDEKGRFQKVSYKVVDGVVEDVKIRLTRTIPIIEDDAMPLFVAEKLKKMVGAMSKGRTVGRTQVREIVQLIDKGEEYWLEDVLSKINESMEGQEWHKMYESNMAQIRTLLHGRLGKIESGIPKTKYTSIAKDKLSNFTGELAESLTIMREIVESLVDETQNIVFHKDNEFFCAIQASLIAEAQAVTGLLRKAEKLMRPEDVGRMAMAHDKFAERAKTMAIVFEYLKDRAQNDEE